MSRTHVHKIIEVKCLEVPKWTANKPATLFCRCTCDAIAQGDLDALIGWWEHHLALHMCTFPERAIAFHLQVGK